MAYCILTGCDATVDCRGRVAGGQVENRVTVRCGDDLEVCEVSVVQSGTLIVRCPYEKTRGKQCVTQGFCFVPTEMGIVPGIHWPLAKPREVVLRRVADVSIDDKDRCCFGITAEFTSTSTVERE
jgi:hypothetical protein